MNCKLLVFSLIASACACGPTPRPAVISGSPAPSDPIHALTRQLDTLLAEPALERTSWGVSIKSLDRDETLYARDARKLLMPASSLKVVTLAVAADQLGWDYTYETRLLASGEIVNGSLQGDLVIVGSGDPSIDDWDGAATRLFHEWAEEIKAAGISRVEGRIIGDDNTFAEDAIGFGWGWDDLASSYGTAIGALQFNEDTAQVVVTPGRSIGDRARVEVRPQVAPVTVRSRVTTTRVDTPAAVAIRALPRAGTIDVYGSIPISGTTEIRNVSVENPTLYFANALRQALAIDGIDVLGPTMDIDELPAGAPRTGRLLVTHRSPPLSALAITMMKLSQNLYAETLLRTVGVRASREGSAEAGRAATLRTLGSWDIADGDVTMVDGSGLSRYNLITADALNAVLAHAHRDDRLRGPFEATLPVAGRDGTLADRMKGTAAEANARAKTGSFSNARALAGYVRSADGEVLAFSLIANNYAAPVELVQRAMDDIVISLARFSRK